MINANFVDKDSEITRLEKLCDQKDVLIDQLTEELEVLAHVARVYVDNENVMFEIATPQTYVELKRKLRIYAEADLKLNELIKKYHPDHRKSDEDE